MFSHTCTEDDDAFDKQLEKLGGGGLFSYQPGSITRELRAYIEDWGKYLMKNMTKDIVLNSWKNMVVSLFMILILKRDILFKMNTLTL